MHLPQIKMNAPKAHTFLEVIRVRWGTIPHVVFTFYAFATAFLVSSMLITVRLHLDTPCPRVQANGD